MKTFSVKSNGKTYNVKAKDAQHAARLVKLLQKDANDYVVTIGGDPKKAVKTKEEAIREAKSWQKVVGKNVLCEVMYSPEDYSDDKVVWKAYGLRDSVKDAASAREVIQQLIDDEASAIAAYNIAIKNLTGKLDEQSIAVLKSIRDDEERHSENLFAIMSGNVTEKNLQDSNKLTR